MEVELSNDDKTLKVTVKQTTENEISIQPEGYVHSEETAPIVLQWVGGELIILLYTDPQQSGPGCSIYMNSMMGVNENLSTAFRRQKIPIRNIKFIGK